MPSGLSISPPRGTSRIEPCSGRSLESPLTGVACSGDEQQQGLDKSSSLDEPAGIEITQEDMESVGVILGRIIDLNQDHLEPQHDEKVVTLLDAHVQAVMGTMNERMMSASKETSIQEAEMLRAKHDLYDICFQELVSTTNATNPGLSQVLDALRDAHSALIQEVPGIVRRAIHKNAEEIYRLEEERERGAKETADLLEASRALEREATKYSREIGVLQYSQRKLERENASLRKMLEERSSSVHRNKHESFATEPSVADVNSTKTSSDTRGRSMTTTLCGTDREARRDTPNTSLAEVHSLANGKESGGPAATGEEREKKKETSREMSLKHLKDFISSVYASKEKYDKQCDVQRLPKQTLWEHLDEYIAHRYGLKPIAKAQAEAMWAAVKKYRGVDNAVTVFELILRNEVEEYFHREQKRLEQAVVDFLRSEIRKRAAARRDVAIAFPRGVGDGRTSNAVTDFFLRNQTRPDAPLSATDWQAVICHVYQGSVADAQTVSVLVRKDISNRRPRGLVGHKEQHHGCLVMGEGEGPWSSSVPFGVFLQTLLGYQLDIHLRSLEQLREDFRKVDLDADGILDRAQFTTLAKQTLLRRAKTRVDLTSSPHCGPPPAIDRDPSWAVAPACEDGRRRDGDTRRRRKSNIDDLVVERLKVSDPHGFGRITFSECVKCLAPRSTPAGFADG